MVSGSSIRSIFTSYEMGNYDMSPSRSLQLPLAVIYFENCDPGSREFWTQGFNGWLHISTSLYAANISLEIYNYLPVEESTRDSYTNVRSRTVTYGSFWNIFSTRYSLLSNNLTFLKGLKSLFNLSVTEFKTVLNSR